MEKVHVTLVGGQPAPIYHGIVATHPDKVVFIYSEGSRSVLETLLSEIKVPVDEQAPLDPTDPAKILQRAKDLAERYANDDITLNISSGLKSWAYLFGIVFHELPNAAVVYMDQNNVLWNYRTMQSQSNFNFDMHVLFRLYGNAMEDNYKRFDEYTEKDSKMLARIEWMRSFNTNDFNKLSALLDNQRQNELRSRKTGEFVSGKSYIRWKKKEDNQLDEVVDIYLQKKNGTSKSERIASPHAISLVFNSGWFEYKVAKMLSTWDKAKEICMNCHFPFRANVDKNETDIIVNTGTKLLFVECKTQITHTTDIDKFRSVVKGYGGTGSKGLFVTLAKMSDIARKKCEENNILSFSMEDAARWHIAPEKALSMLLDNELFNINTK